MNVTFHLHTPPPPAPAPLPGWRPNSEAPYIRIDHGTDPHTGRTDPHTGRSGHVVDRLATKLDQGLHPKEWAAFQAQLAEANKPKEPPAAPAEPPAAK
jgi:hypothetical protein